MTQQEIVDKVTTHAPLGDGNYLVHGDIHYLAVTTHAPLGDGNLPATAITSLRWSYNPRPVRGRTRVKQDNARNVLQLQPTPR